MHALDNPVWHALTGPHATVAQRAGFAARYIPEVAVFGALADDPSPAAWNDLRDLVGPGGAAFLARSELKVPDAWTVHVNVPCRQMWLLGELAANDGVGDDGHAVDDPLVALGAADVPDMLALVERTRPGPFATRTVELGTYLGVRHDDALIAMAGERLHPAGFTEISAVCTDPEYRGGGLAARLVRALVRGIRDRSEMPFLHLTLENDPAHRLYSALGFETRTFLEVLGLGAPA